ncbi:MAG TPA: DinB family protein [Clostridia bacterium]|nr:DinB family protein [Clostridia bacterium]
MAINQGLLAEFDHEALGTRTTLERVPEDKFGWKPHPKSPTMGWLASHVANLPSWTAMTLEQDSVDIAPAGPERPRSPEAKSRAELLESFDQNVAKAREVLARTADEAMMKPWSLLKGGETIFTQPRIAVLRGFVFNHLIHHRAQLTVYLRLNDIPVPALYGPSADEGQM